MNADPGEGRAGGRRANGALEAEVLELLRAAGEALTAGQVLELLGGGLSYSTVVTTLTRLRDKQVLTRVPAGRAFAYRPVTDGPGLAARRMHQVLASGPDRAQVLTRFVGELPDGDAALLRSLLDGDPQPPAREG